MKDFTRKHRRAQLALSRPCWVSECFCDHGAAPAAEIYVLVLGPWPGSVGFAFWGARVPSGGCLTGSLERRMLFALRWRTDRTACVASEKIRDGRDGDPARPVPPPAASRRSVRHHARSHRCCPVTEHSPPALSGMAAASYEHFAWPWRLRPRPVTFTRHQADDFGVRVSDVRVPVPPPLSSSNGFLTPPRRKAHSQ